MTPVEQLVEHARMMSRRARRPGSDGWRHGSIHDVVLAHGRIFEPAPLPNNVYPALPGHACQAATILADQHALNYVEGLALLPDMHTVIEHAWCADFTGQVVDPNLSGQSAAAYLGIAFTMNFRRTALASPRGMRPILIGDPASTANPDLEILEHGLAPETTLEIGKPYSSTRAASADVSRERPAQHAKAGESPSATSGAGIQTRDRLASAA